MSAFQRYQELQQYVGWTEEDAERVKSIGPALIPAFDALIDDFYAEIERHPEASKVITGGPEQTARLKRTLHGWLHELFSGRYDQDYVERRWRVGYRHVDIGLNQVYTNAALSRLRRGLLKGLEKVWRGSTDDLLACRGSLNTLLDLDLAIIEDAYQTEYRRRQSSAERLATIGKVAGGIAHELRNPLNVVKTSVYFLMNVRNVPEEKKRVHLERIERQVGVADGVITALNDFARLPIPQMEPVAVEACLKDAIELNPLPSTIELQWNLQPHDVAILGDRSQLSIVFGNLIRNARDAMAGAGILRLGASAEGGSVAITIQDTGKGIPPEHLPHIFEPLYSTKAKGIGLGLSISRDIIDRHHGTLAISSVPGVGSTFTIRLPAAS
jgi:signal transduction histidine kinase